MTNIGLLERSELIVAKILAHLQTKGVSRSDFHPEEIGLENSDVDLFINAISWLESEGIIRSQNVSHSGRVYAAVLTAYGFALMGKPLKIGEDHSTLGREFDKISSDPSAYSKAGDFFGSVLGGLTKSLGN